MKNKLTISILFMMFYFCSLYAQVTQQWVARYNGPGNNSDVAHSLAVDASGNVYLTGQSIGSGTDYDYATIKYDSSGVQQWVTRYTRLLENRADYAYSLAVDVSGNVYVTGASYGNGTNDDYATIKYNTNGDSVWVRRYNGPTGNGGDMAHSLAVDSSGNVYVTGASVGMGFDYATIKYNSSGVQQWVARYNGPVNAIDQARSLAVDASGNVYVTGVSAGSGTDYDYATIKYNSSGVQQWVARYNGPGNGFESAHSLAVDGSGNVYVTGVSAGSGTNYDYATIKYNSNGDTLWVRRYIGPGNSDDWAFSLAVDGLSNVYVTGGSRGNGTSYDWATIKYNSNGDSVWVRRYNGPGNGSDQAGSLVVDGLGNVYVTGASAGSGTGSDYATIKYSQMVGIKPVSNKIPSEFLLNQNYPNPFNPSTKIKFEIPNSKLETNSKTEIRIYDVLGREIATIVNEQLSPGTYEVEWEAANYPSGVYYYRLTALQTGSSTGDYSETKKMILVK